MTKILNESNISDFTTMFANWQAITTMNFENRNDFETASMMFRGLGFSVLELEVDGDLFLKVSINPLVLQKESERLESKR